MKNVIRYATNNPNLEIEVTNQPLPYTYLEKKNSKERNSSILLVFISICFTLIPANFVTIIIREKENNSKHLQIISGISLMSYWVNNFIFELVKYYIVGAVCLVFLEAFGFYEDYVVVLYVLYGPPMVAFTYIIGSLVKREGTGQVLVILINLVCIRPAVVALIAAPTFNLASKAKISLYNCWIPILSALAIWLMGVNPVIVIIVAALGGYLYGKFFSGEK